MVVAGSLGCVDPGLQHLVNTILAVLLLIIYVDQVTMYLLCESTKKQTFTKPKV